MAGTDLQIEKNDFVCIDILLSVPALCRTPAVQHYCIWSHCQVNPNIACAVLKTPCGHHVIGGCRSRQTFWGVMDFCPNFPKLGRKVFAWLLPTYFLQERSWRRFLDVTSKKCFHAFFCKRWVPFGIVKQCLASFVPGISGFFLDVQGFAHIFDKPKL